MYNQQTYRSFAECRYISLQCGNYTIYLWQKS